AAVLGRDVKRDWLWKVIDHVAGSVVGGVLVGGASVLGSRPAAKRCITKNVPGIKKRGFAGAAIFPPMTVEPRMRRATAPEPLANHKGISPKMKAKEVIRIGRRRKRAPSSAASSSVSPFSYSAL